MLEVGADEPLRTWRLLARPTAGGTIPAEPLGEHRREYLAYEGRVSGDRGSVSRWDEGRYRQVSEEADGGLVLEFDGTVLRGTARLRPDGEAWVLELGERTG